MAAAGIASVKGNLFATAHHEKLTAEQAKRNHLVRRGLAEALLEALGRVREKYKAELSSGLYKELFASWLGQLNAALDDPSPDSHKLEELFPLDEISEDPWVALTRYEAHDEAWAVRQRSEEVLRLWQSQEKDDAHALAVLLRDYLTKDPDDPSAILTDRLFLSWDLKQAEEFAAKLLPLHRTSFAAVFSRGGPLAEAIGYKGMTLTLDKLVALEESLKKAVGTINAHTTAVGEGVKIHTTEQVTALGDRIVSEIREGRGAQTIPGFAWRLESMLPPVGLDSQRIHARNLWLADRERPLLIWGSPGIEKSTLARWILRDPEVKERFGHRRYELRCDYIAGAADFVARLASTWFGVVDTDSDRLAGIVLAHLAKKPCAILVDNF